MIHTSFTFGSQQTLSKLLRPELPDYRMRNAKSEAQIRPSTLGSENADLSMIEVVKLEGLVLGNTCSAMASK